MSTEDSSQTSFLKSDVHATLERYECGPFRFTRKDYYDRHLVFDHAVELGGATPRDRFEALARSLRDLLTQRWIKTQQTHDERNVKRVYYLSMEYLLGRTLAANILNLGVERFVREDLQSDGIDWRVLADEEPDAGLGNGGLGRLAACFIESLATLEIPAYGCGLRYEHGIFRQTIQNGYQIEQPDNWLLRPDPWEVKKPGEAVEVKFACSLRLQGGMLEVMEGEPLTLRGIPYDRPVVGYGGKTINTLRLWAAAAPEEFDFKEFSRGDWFGAVHDKVLAESLTRVLYPDDSSARNQALRFMQEFFLVACSLADIVRRFRRANSDWHDLPQKVAIQMNDTHPAMAVAELMRILLDEARLDWETAWELTVNTLAYTNHTLLPEALERWPVRLFELGLPRQLEIIYEINRRFLDDVLSKHPGDEERVRRMSLIEEWPERRVRMAHLAVVGSHSTNGVAQIHSRLLRSRLMPELAAMFPDRFGNKTNGVTPRRWLLQANPALSALITQAIGDGWVTDLASWPGSNRSPNNRISAALFSKPSGKPRPALPTGSKPPRATCSTRPPFLTARSSASMNTRGSCSTSCTL